jgi:hypothetical protein
VTSAEGRKVGEPFGGTQDLHLAGSERHLTQRARLVLVFGKGANSVWYQSLWYLRIHIAVLNWSVLAVMLLGECLFYSRCRPKTGFAVQRRNLVNKPHLVQHSSPNPLINRFTDP